MDVERIAQRLYDLCDPWERDDITIKELVNRIEKDPQYFIEWLLDFIDDLNARGQI